ASAERWTVPMSDPATPPGPSAQQNIDTSVPHSARIWNYWLGGKDNYPVDEQAGDAYTAVFPGIVTIARSSRAFLRRNITYLVTEARSEEHTSELQSRENLVCRLLLETKNPE